MTISFQMLSVVYRLMCFLNLKKKKYHDCLFPNKEHFLLYLCGNFILVPGMTHGHWLVIQNTIYWCMWDNVSCFDHRLLNGKNSDVLSVSFLVFDHQLTWSCLSWSLAQLNFCQQENVDFYKMVIWHIAAHTGLKLKLVTLTRTSI